MAIILIPVCFIAIFLCNGICYSERTSKRELLLTSVLFQSLILLAITELLNAFSLLTFTPILLSWIAIFLVLLIFLFIKRTQAKVFAGAVWVDIKKTYATFHLIEKLLVYGIGIIFLLIFIQGIIYPPNNWDSLSYHMARIPYWLSHHSLAPYPTHIIRQIYQPPFAEYVIMHADVLNGSDVFSASVQFVYFIFMLIAVAAIAKSLGLSRYYQLLSVFFGATLPEAVLQASSTQNDIVECFFVLATLYFVIKAIKESTFHNYLFIGLSVGMAMMTKATAYIYLAPVLMWFVITVLIKLIREKNFTPFKYAVIAILLIIGINTPRTLRNYRASGNIWGTTPQELSIYSNTHFSPAFLASGVVKNAGLHLGLLGAKRVAVMANQVVNKLHNAAHININDPGNTYGTSKYSSPVFGDNHEDTAPNFLHLILIAVATVILASNFFKGKSNTELTVLFWIMFLQIILFCAYLRWQPWNSRLHLPMFMLGCVLVVYAMSVSRIFKTAFYVIVPVIFIYCIDIVLRNATRPYIDIDNGKISFTTISRPRYQNYFNNLPNRYPEYADITQSIQKSGYKNIGLLLSSNDFEYPLFSNCFGEEISPMSIMVHNYTQNSIKTPYKVDCIVSTDGNKPFIDYAGKRFYNKTANHKFIYLYQ